MMEKTEQIEFKILLEALNLKYGYDFSGYANASLTRRIKSFCKTQGFSHISGIIPQVLYDEVFFYMLLQQLTVHVTEMFRDPKFFRALRDIVLPALSDLPFIKIWCVGISTGEEVYSLAILLKEEKLHGKSLIYATDMNDTVLAAAQKGIYPIDMIKAATLNYQQSGGRESFGMYYHADYDGVIMERSLKNNVRFANHNLVDDASLGEMHLILCRNVMIYFNTDLQEKVLELFNECLMPGGILCLGTRETLEFSKVKDVFDLMDRKNRIFRKKRYDL